MKIGGTLIQSWSLDSAWETESEHTMVWLLGSNLLVTKLNKLHVYLAVLF